MIVLQRAVCIIGHEVTLLQGVLCLGNGAYPGSGAGIRIGSCLSHLYLFIPIGIRLAFGGFE